MSHNQRVGFAAADACRLPFKDGAFDSIYCVAVLQHIDEVDTAVREFARVTAPRGRVVAVEPDNSARYVFSSTPLGRRAFECRRSSSSRWPARAAIDPRRSARSCPALFATPRHRAARRAAVSRVADAARSAGRRGLAGARARGRGARSAARRPMPPAGSAASTSTSLDAYEREANAAGVVLRRDPEHDAVRHRAEQKAVVGRPRRLGRLRAVLRLGERAHAGPARRAVLAEPRAAGRRPGPRAGLRHRPHLASARPRRRAARRHRSIGADAGAARSAHASRAPARDTIR